MVSLPCWIMSIVMTIAPQYDVPPYLVAAIIIKESQGNPLAVGRNNNGTYDRGLMQLNSSWFNGDWRCPETNILYGVRHLAWLYRETRDRSPHWWGAIVAYNCGLARYQSDRGPPASSLDYADDVMRIWNELCPVRRRIYR